MSSGSRTKNFCGYDFQIREDFYGSKGRYGSLKRDFWRVTFPSFFTKLFGGILLAYGVISLPAVASWASFLNFVSLNLSHAVPFIFLISGVVQGTVEFYRAWRRYKAASAEENRGKNKWREASKEALKGCIKTGFKFVLIYLGWAIGMGLAAALGWFAGPYLLLGCLLVAACGAIGAGIAAGILSIWDKDENSGNTAFRVFFEAFLWAFVDQIMGINAVTAAAKAAYFCVVSLSTSLTFSAAGVLHSYLKGLWNCLRRSRLSVAKVNTIEFFLECLHSKGKKEGMVDSANYIPFAKELLFGPERTKVRSNLWTAGISNGRLQRSVFEFTASALALKLVEKRKAAASKGEDELVLTPAEEEFLNMPPPSPWPITIRRAHKGDAGKERPDTKIMNAYQNGNETMLRRKFGEAAVELKKWGLNPPALIALNVSPSEGIVAATSLSQTKLQNIRRWILTGENPSTSTSESKREDDTGAGTADASIPPADPWNTRHLCGMLGGNRECFSDGGLALRSAYVTNTQQFILSKIAEVECGKTKDGADYTYAQASTAIQAELRKKVVKEKSQWMRDICRIWNGRSEKAQEFYDLCSDALAAP